jgi:hypothetical protein
LNKNGIEEESKGDNNYTIQMDLNLEEVSAINFQIDTIIIPPLK